MTKFKINLTESPDEISSSCPFGRAILGEYNPLREQYDFSYELDLLIEKLNSIEDITCEKKDEKIIVIESSIDTIGVLQEKMKGVFSAMICRIRYDCENPMEIIN